MKELGPGFLERVYRNALLIAMKQKGLQVEVEQGFEVIFRGKVIGRYCADLVVEQTVLVPIWKRLWESQRPFKQFEKIYRSYRYIVLTVDYGARQKDLASNMVLSNY